VRAVSSTPLPAGQNIPRAVIRHRAPLTPGAVALARRLRQEASFVERIVWRWLRDRRFSACKFRRQHEMGPYFLDFFCFEARLAIELDGRQHGEPDQAAADRRKDAWLAARGIKVLRFWNSTVLREKQAVRDTIWRELQARAPKPLPAYQRPGVIGRRMASAGPHPGPLPQGEGDASTACVLPHGPADTCASGLSPSPSGRGPG
jgi:very-short-patch-repair endonuclease